MGGTKNCPLSILCKLLCEFVVSNGEKDKNMLFLRPNCLWLYIKRFSMHCEYDMDMDPFIKDITLIISEPASFADLQKQKVVTITDEMKRKRLSWNNGI